MSEYISKSKVLEIIDQEPEYDDAMPEDMKEFFDKNFGKAADIVVECMKISVRLTKQNIREKVEQLT